MGKKKKWIVVCISVGLLLLAIISLNPILAPIAARKLTTIVQEKSHGSYLLHFNKLELNIFSGNASLDGVRLIHQKTPVDTAALAFEGSVSEIRVSGVGLFRFIFQKELLVDNFHVTNAEISLTRRHNATSKNGRPSLYQRLAPFARTLGVGHLSFSDIKIHYRDRAGNIERADLGRSDIEADDLLINEGAENDSTRTIYCKKIRASIQDLSGNTTKDTYHFSLKRGLMETSKRHIKLNGINLEPLNSMLFFKIERTDRLELALDSLHLQEMDLHNLLQRGMLKAHHITGSNGHFAVFGNPMGKPQAGDRAVSFPNAVLQRMRTRVNIDTVDLASINVRYQEMKRSTGLVGTVDFLRTNAHFTHITNDRQELLADPWCKVRLTTMVMGKARLSLKVGFHMNDPLYRYDIGGHMGSMPAVNVNPVSVPLAGVRVNKGQINSMDILIHGDRRKSTGTVQLRYKDIYVDLVQKDNDRKLLKTFLVNTFVLEHNNPEAPGEPPRYGQVSLERPLSDPFFKTIWNTLLAGFKSCIGVSTSDTPQNEQKESLPKKMIRAIGDLFKKDD